MLPSPFYLAGGAEGELELEPPIDVIDDEGQVLVLPPVWSFMSLSVFILRMSSSTGIRSPVSADAGPVTSMPGVCAAF